MTMKNLCWILLLGAALLPNLGRAQDDLDALARRAGGRAQTPAATEPAPRAGAPKAPSAKLRAAEGKVASPSRAMQPGTARGNFVESSQLRGFLGRPVPAYTWLTGQFTYTNQMEGGRWVCVSTAMLFFKGQTRVLLAFPRGKQANLNHDGMVLLVDRTQPLKLERVVERNGVLTVYATNPFSQE